MTDPNHIAEARKNVSRQQIREVFLRNGFTIKPGCDDLREYVYKAAFELLELAAPAVQGEPTASPTSGMNLGQRIQHVGGRETERGTVEFGSVMAVEALVSHVLRDIAVQGEPDVAQLVEALEQGFPLLSDEGLDEVEHHCEYVIQRERKRVHSILAAHRKQEPSHDNQ